MSRLGLCRRCRSCKGLTTDGMVGCGTGQPLPPRDAEMDGDWVEINHPSVASGLFCCNEHCPDVTERIEDQPTRFRAIADCIGDHGDRLCSGTLGKIASGFAARCALAGVIPNIAPLA